MPSKKNVGFHLFFRNQNILHLSSSTRRQQDELITLSSDEETGSNSGAVQLDGEPEVQVILSEK